MKKFLIGLLFFTYSTVLIGQAEVKEKHERYVGISAMMYPLTVLGIQNAIISLPDGGVIHVDYPSVDTSGVGPIPDNI